ncbi:MAG: outer membrane beta-barrel protein [Candidatus Eisenbacteria bacterium]|uniref:Outer membrane beta-barrel protein n=1 Tax=Eiseniibacteriota bacterium TaxID=2212470 RepID=A0A849SCQ6_UNCEI|nr:outer membrane beta-barrel protein [Candidatus Eisenbacteria bacterium]
MKRWSWSAVVLAALMPCLAQAGMIGIGAYGGLSIPIAQDDNGQGPIFGLRVPVRLAPMFTVEPFFAMTQAGDADQEIGGIQYTRDGFEATGFGANLLLTFGDKIQFYPFGGLSMSTLSREGSEDLELTGFNFGLGLGVSPVEKVRLHLRGEGQSLIKDERGRMFGNVTVGVSYDLFPFGQ